MLIPVSSPSLRSGRSTAARALTLAPTKPPVRSFPAALVVLAVAFARHAFAGGAPPNVIPEGTQGLAYSEHDYCGVDGAIISFRESFGSWLTAQGIDDASVPEARDDFLRHIGAMP